MRTWEEIADEDWVILPTGGRLHALRCINSSDAANMEWSAKGETECGRGGTLSIPGVEFRRHLQRCKWCCRATGLPPGIGSPRNDVACRKVLGL